MMSIISIAVGLTLLSTAAGCGKKAEEKALVPAPSAQVDLEADEETISEVTLAGHTDAGRKKWEVRGETADLSAEVVELSPVSATSYGVTQVDLTADKGKLTRATQDVVLTGNVVIVASDGTTLNTETLDWEAQKEIVSTQDWVTITQVGMKVDGQGGVGFPSLRRMRLKEDITVVLTTEEGDETVVTCDGPMEVDYGRMKIRFWENVLVREAAGTIRSDRLDVTVDQKTHEMERATFWGDVKIDRGERTARAQRAHYWQSEGRMSLVGHPEFETPAEQLIQ